MVAPVLHLASSSPRRRALLQALGIPFSYAGVDIDETPLADEPVEDMVLRLARDKVLTAGESGAYDVPILGADTAVASGREIFGKPASKEEALAMLDRLSGRTHRVLTAIGLYAGGAISTAVSVTDVRFRVIGPDEALAYWRSGEPAGKAGAYAIQGRGGAFVESLAGSYSGVVGLPMFETAALLGRAGIDVLQTNDGLIP